MRCNDCGTNWNSASRACPACGAVIVEYPAAAAPSLAEAGAWDESLLRQSASTGTTLEDSPSAVAPRRGEVVGEIVFIEHIASEEMDFDWCRFLSRVVWFGVFVLAPFFVLAVIVTKLGPFSLLLAVFGLWMLVKFLMPNNLWSLLQMARLLNPFGHREAVIPVRHLRVRTVEGWQVMVRMKGRPLRGNLMQDDAATFLGGWRDGVFFSKRAYVHRTRSWVEMEDAYSWVALLVSLIVLATIIFYLHLAVTNVSSQLQPSSEP